MTGVRKKALLLLALAVFLSSLFPTVSVYADKVKMKTYVVYDSPERFGDKFPLVTALAEYLGHFDVACRTMPVEAWQPGGLRDAELIVYVGMKNITLPPGLLQEMAQAPRVVWFEKNIEQLAACLKWQDFRLEGVSSGWSSINYRKNMMINDWLEVVVAQPGQGAQVFATVENAGNSKPLAWRRDNVYFCGLLEVSDPSCMVALSNLLHQFIPNNHSHEHRVLLRIEDVSPLTDPKAVRAVIAAINKYRVPFAIGVIPVGASGNGKSLYLHETPQLVRVLKEAQDSGASIIMHGYTHQNEYSPKTGEGYEFWNARDDKPMDNDEAFTSERLEAGIAELVRCGLIPVAFEPPHYAMSETGYRVLPRYFNIYSGQVQISDRSAKITLTLPYLAESSYAQGVLIIPENMGYYDGKSFCIDKMLQDSEQLLEAQDGFACLFYHGYLPPDKLPSLIEGVIKQGYTFFDLRQLPVRVQSSQIKIVGRQGQFTLEVDEKLQASWGEASVAGNFLGKIGAVHVIILLVVLLLFIIIIFKLRLNATRHYEKPGDHR